MKNFIFYDYVYFEDEIQQIKDLCKTATWERKYDYDIQNPGETPNNGNRYVFTPDKILNGDKLISSYLNFIPEYAAKCLEDGLHLSKGYTEDVKISKYDQDDRYGWHCDNWVLHPKTPYWRRQISSITYLNDDYEGGQTEFEGDIIITPEAGKTLIFPSYWLFPHQGRIVTKGTKYIYVNHIWV